jgi:hypothetical protein
MALLPSDAHPARPFAEQGPADDTMMALDIEEPPPDPVPPEMRKADDMERMTGMKMGDGKTHKCPMHADVTAQQPGKCPKCGMQMIPESAQEDKE